MKCWSPIHVSSAVPSARSSGSIGGGCRASSSTTVRSRASILSQSVVAARTSRNTRSRSRSSAASSSGSVSRSISTKRNDSSVPPASGAVGCGTDAEHPAGGVALDAHDRVHDEMEPEIVPFQFHRDRVDEEGHVVVHDLDDACAARPSRLLASARTRGRVQRRPGAAGRGPSASGPLPAALSRSAARGPRPGPARSSAANTSRASRRPGPASSAVAGCSSFFSSRPWSAPVSPESGTLRTLPLPVRFHRGSRATPRPRPRTRRSRRRDHDAAVSGERSRSHDEARPDAGERSRPRGRARTARSHRGGDESLGRR